MPSADSYARFQDRTNYDPESNFTAMLLCKSYSTSLDQSTRLLYAGGLSPTPEAKYIGPPYLLIFCHMFSHPYAPRFAWTHSGTVQICARFLFYIHLRRQDISAWHNHKFRI